MNWDQIEIKWAAMARRVRSDLPPSVQLETVGPNKDPPLTPPGDLPEPPLPEVRTANAR